MSFSHNIIVLQGELGIFKYLVDQCCLRIVRPLCDWVACFQGRALLAGGGRHPLTVMLFHGLKW